MEDEIEDFGEDMEAVAAKVSGLQWEVQTMRNTLENELGVVQKEILQHTESQHRLAQELAMMEGDINSTLCPSGLYVASQVHVAHCWLHQGIVKCIATGSFHVKSTQKNPDIFRFRRNLVSLLWV